MRKQSLKICLTAFAILIAGVNADAQLLKSLSKGLEKVNKELEKVEKSLQSGNNKSSGKANTSKQSSQNSSSSGKTAINESGWKQVKPAYLTPYFTAETKFMETNPSEYYFSDVHDGVFAIKRGAACEFWKVTGEKLFDAEWKYAGGIGGLDFPIFSSGVAAARRATPNANGKTPICLLYLDGRVKELDPSWETVSQFMDGVALVTAKINYKEHVFYIDISGNKLYPNLKVDKAVVNPMRPLCNDMRAYYGPGANPSDGYKWGFIDAKGNVKIAPRYNAVSDFANGYAWVTTSNFKTGVSYKELIDVTGKVVLKVDGQNTHTSDVADGVFCVEERDRNVYYDLNGKELASYRSGCGFYNGNAFIAKGYEHADVIDRNFNIVKRMPYDYCNATDVDYNRPDFKPFGLATVNTGETVINPEGDIVLTSYNNHKGTYISGFGQFSESGYMKATNFYISGKQCMAYVKPTGEIAWLFSDTKSFGVEEPPLPTPPGSKPPIPVPPFPPQPVDPEQPPIGPRVIEKVSFTVNVVASPAEGGSVSISPTGKFGYGENASISASPNKDWAVQSIETDVVGLTAPKIGKPFAVVADQTITVNFVEKEEEEAPDNFGTYQGQLTFEEWPLPVYAEINRKGAEENPYGVDNYGFVSIMFDPSKRYVDKKGELAVNFFAVPLKIVGIQKERADSTKQWLIVEGGSVTAHNIKISPNSNPLMGMAMNAMIALDGFSSINTKPRRYRIEMLDRDAETGEFRFGNMQTYSVKAGGWVGGDDSSLEDTKTGFFGSSTDRGYPSDTFTGVMMKKAPKRNDILWYPPETWSKDKSVYEILMESMRQGYKSTKSDYEQLFGE